MLVYLYKYINKNRKLLREKISKCNFVLTGDGVQLIHADNLINILKDTINIFYIKYKIYFSKISIKSVKFHKIFL